MLEAYIMFYSYQPASEPRALLGQWLIIQMTVTWLGGELGSPRSPGSDSTDVSYALA